MSVLRPVWSPAGSGLRVRLKRFDGGSSARWRPVDSLLWRYMAAPLANGPAGERRPHATEAVGTGEPPALPLVPGRPHAPWPWPSPPFRPLGQRRTCANIDVAGQPSGLGQAHVAQVLAEARPSRRSRAGGTDPGLNKARGVTSHRRRSCPRPAVVSVGPTRPRRTRRRPTKGICRGGVRPPV